MRLKRRRGHVLLWTVGLTASVATLAAGGLWTAPRILANSNSATADGCLFAVPSRERVVALTIDDGPARVPSFNASRRCSGFGPAPGGTTGG